MAARFDDFKAALATVFSDHAYLLLGIASAFLAAVAFVYVPVATTPGSDFDFYLSIAPWWNYAILAVFAVGFGLMVPMQAYLWRNGRAKPKVKASGLAPLLSSALAGVYATAACAACVTTAFSFLGFGFTLFLLEYRLPLLALSVLMLAASVYYTARQIAGNCPECAVKR